MAEWPDLAEVKQVLDITSEDWDGEGESGLGPTRLSRLLAAAVEKVQRDCCKTVALFEVEYPEGPDEMLAQAALRMAELIALRPEVAVGAVADPTYNRLLFGHRKSFGVA